MATSTSTPAARSASPAAIAYSRAGSGRSLAAHHSAARRVSSTARPGSLRSSWLRSSSRNSRWSRYHCRRRSSGVVRRLTGPGTRAGRPTRWWPARRRRGARTCAPAPSSGSGTTPAAPGGGRAARTAGSRPGPGRRRPGRPPGRRGGARHRRRGTAKCRATGQPSVRRTSSGTSTLAGSMSPNSSRELASPSSIARSSGPSSTTRPSARRRASGRGGSPRLAMASCDPSGR